MKYIAKTRVAWKEKTYEIGQEIDALPADKAALLLESGSVELVVNDEEAALLVSGDAFVLQDAETEAESEATDEPEAAPEVIEDTKVNSAVDDEAEVETEAAAESETTDEPEAAPEALEDTNVSSAVDGDAEVETEAAPVAKPKPQKGSKK